MTLQDLYQQRGATIAPDGIPLHFGDLAAEYDAASERSVLLDRSHEGRLYLSGDDRLTLIDRISTNALAALAPLAGQPTIFTNANARIIDRVTVYNRVTQTLLITEPGRGPAVAGYLQRNVFFNDDLHIADITATTRQLALHGPTADAVMAAFVGDLPPADLLAGVEATIADAPVFAARNKPLSDRHWTLVTSAEDAAAVWSALLAAGAAHGLQPAGSLTYNALRIRAGHPGVGRELSTDYIPLEVGLFDEIDFAKGCYTGQEVIARMESRNRLAKIMVRVTLSGPVDAPADMHQNGRSVGRLTSSVQTPDGASVGIAVIKPGVAQPETVLTVGSDGVTAHVIDIAGTPPPMVTT